MIRKSAVAASELEVMKVPSEKKDVQLERKDVQLERKDVQLEKKDVQLEKKNGQWEAKSSLTRKNHMMGLERGARRQSPLLG